MEKLNGPVVVVRDMIFQDSDKVYAYVRENWRYHQQPVESVISLEEFRKHAFENNSFHGLVAEVYTGIEMKILDLIVEKKFRRKKIATKMLAELFKRAKKMEAKGISVLLYKFNKEARNLYINLGGEIHEEYNTCSFSPKVYE